MYIKEDINNRFDFFFLIILEIKLFIVGFSNLYIE